VASGLSALAGLEGVSVAELRQIVDSRGAVLHMLRADAPDFAGFGECYFSEVAPGAIKAWKRHRLQTQNIAVPVGRVRLVLVDMRREGASPHVVAVELGRPDAYVRVRIPPYVWYGFSCVSPEAALLVNCADRPHDPGESDSRPLDDPTIPFRW
jgi:dTDP-4-dehydrorhamnose 3,5-epimerase